MNIKENDMTDIEIFKACFPEYRISSEVFERVTAGSIRFCTEHGFAHVRGGRIELLCVHPKYQRCGEGRRLLSLCEQHVSDSGTDTVSVGGRLVCGAEERTAEFFGKNGYELDGSFTEMELPLDGFSVPEVSLPENAEFGFYSGDTDTLRRAVNEVDEEWVQYFTDDGLFFCCLVDREIASFCIVGGDEDFLLSDGAARIGSVGCVGTVPKFRKKGLGLHMVALASQWLKEQGCDSVFIHYTHLDKWYGKLGAKVFQRFTTAEKMLR